MQVLSLRYPEVSPEVRMSARNLQANTHSMRLEWT